MLLKQPEIHLLLTWHINRQKCELVMRLDNIYINMAYRVAGANGDRRCQQVLPAAASVKVVLHIKHKLG